MAKKESGSDGKENYEKKVVSEVKVLNFPVATFL